MRKRHGANGSAQRHSGCAGGRENRQAGDQIGAGTGRGQRLISLAASSYQDETPKLLLSTASSFCAICMSCPQCPQLAPAGFFHSRSMGAETPEQDEADEAPDEGGPLRSFL